MFPAAHESIMSNPPKPAYDDQAYTRGRLQIGLRYVATKLMRDLTPRTRNFLQLHKNAYKKALEAETGTENSVTRVKTVQTFDHIYHSNSFLYKDLSVAETNRLEAVRKIREDEILSNYGDYLGLEVQDLRTRVFTARMDEMEEEVMRAAHSGLSNDRLWTEVADLLGVEQGELATWNVYPGVPILWKEM